MEIHNLLFSLSISFHMCLQIRADNHNFQNIWLFLSKLFARIPTFKGIKIECEC